MGEYGIRKSDGEHVKIGTCERMFYLRYEDRDKIKPEENSLDQMKATGLFWRLPFPDEDGVLPGDYDPHNRGLHLYKFGIDRRGEKYTMDFEDAETVEHPGTIQLRHESSGLLMNVPCYHGLKLPDVREPMRAAWNGKSHSFELDSIKNISDGTVHPVVKCRHCGKMWRYKWADVLPYVHGEMKTRLEIYA